MEKGTSSIDAIADRAVTRSGLARIYRGLCSTRLAVFLFLAICLAALPGTLSAAVKEWCAPFVSLLLFLLALNTLACTARRIASLPRGVLAVHGGVILTLAGAAASGLGSVATVNVYEGVAVSDAYRWDLKADAPLGFDLLVKRIGREYYPTPVRVGVLRDGEKVGLFTTATGGSFDIGGFRASVVALDPSAKNLRLAISRGGRPVGTVDTCQAQRLPGGFPYSFVLVSYQTPRLKRMWVDLRLSQGERILAEGRSEVNAPLHAAGADLFHVQTARDASGRSYAGIQVVRDPGRVAVFAGLILLCLGSLLTVADRFRGRR